MRHLTQRSGEGHLPADHHHVSNPSYRYSAIRTRFLNLVLIRNPFHNPRHFADTHSYKTLKITIKSFNMFCLFNPAYSNKGYMDEWTKEGRKEGTNKLFIFIELFILYFNFHTHIYVIIVKLSFNLNKVLFEKLTTSKLEMLHWQ